MPWSRITVWKKIIMATKDFNSNYYIGANGSGVVYKLVLPLSWVFDVKKLHSLKESVKSRNVMEASEREIQV